MTREGFAAESPEQDESVERLLASRTLLGPRVWGMAVLYYRAGLTQQEIGQIFGMSRQAVTNKLRRAMRLVERTRATLGKRSDSRDS